MNANLTKLLLACFFITLISGNVSSIYIRPGDIVTENYVVGEALPKYPANYDADKKEQPIHSINSVFPSLNDLRIISDGNIEIISNKLDSTISLRLKPDLNFTVINVADINAADGNFVNLGISNNLFGGALYSRGNISIGLGAKYLDADGGSYYVDPSNISVLSLLSVVGSIYSGGDIYTTGTADDFWLGKTIQPRALFRAYATGNLNAVDINAQDLTLDETLTVTGDSNFIDIGITRNIYSDGNFSRLTTVGDINFLGYGLGGNRARVSWNASKGSLSVGLGTVASSFETFAHGLAAKATGNYSTAMGNSAIASGEASVATGQDTTASGVFSTAMGGATQATGAYGFAVGVATRAIGVSSTALGSETEARGNFSIAEGQWTYSDGVGSIAMGTGDNFYKIFAIGEGSVAMGYADVNTAARGKGSVALGYNVISEGEASITLGKDLTNYNANSLLVQDLNVLGDANFTHLAISGLQFADGGIIATGDSNFTNIGISGTLFGGSALTIGSPIQTLGSTASGIKSTALGDNATASGDYSVALGDNTTASGTGSIAIGSESIASNTYSIALGKGVSATQSGSIAIGFNSNAAGSIISSSLGSIVMGYCEESTCFMHADKDGSIVMGFSDAGGIIAQDTGAIAMGNADDGNIFSGGDGSIAMGYADDGNLFSFSAGSIAMGSGHDRLLSAEGEGAISLGVWTRAFGKGAIALGYNANATGQATIAIGENCNAATANAICLGKDLTAYNANQVVIQDLNVLGEASIPAIYLQASDVSDQTFAVAGTPYSVELDTIDENFGISRIEDGNILIRSTGVYYIAAQPQVMAGAGDAGDFHMWLQKDTGGGFADVSNSNVELTLDSLDEDVIPLIDIISLNNGDKIRIRVSVSDTGIELDAQAPAGEPVIPSIIFSMYKKGT